MPWLAPSPSSNRVEDQQKAFTAEVQHVGNGNSGTLTSLWTLVVQYRTWVHVWSPADTPAPYVSPRTQAVQLRLAVRAGGDVCPYPVGHLLMGLHRSARGTAEYSVTPSHSPHWRSDEGVRPTETNSPGSQIVAGLQSLAPGTSW